MEEWKKSIAAGAEQGRYDEAASEGGKVCPRPGSLALLKQTGRIAPS